MKKDIMYTLLGVVLMFGFMTLMFTLFNETQEIKLIEKQIQVDSTLIYRQSLLELNDSLRTINQREIQILLNNHSFQLRRINEKQNQTDLIILDIKKQVDSIQGN
jgi:hypothetical protein